MDQPNFNMRQRILLDTVKDYECEILYHPSMASMVVDALIHRVDSTPIQDVCLRMTIVTPILEMIRFA